MIEKPSIRFLILCTKTKSILSWSWISLLFAYLGEKGQIRDRQQGSEITTLVQTVRQNSTQYAIHHPPFSIESQSAGKQSNTHYSDILKIIFQLQSIICRISTWSLIIKLEITFATHKINVTAQPGRIY